MVASSVKVYDLAGTPVKIVIIKLDLTSSTVVTSLVKGSALKASGLTTEYSLIDKCCSR